MLWLHHNFKAALIPQHVEMHRYGQILMKMDMTAEAKFILN